MKSLVLRLIDAFISPLVFTSAALLKWVRRRDLSRMPVSRRIFRALGVLPIADHYYEPFYAPRGATRGAAPAPRRHLPGIDLNVSGQLELLAKFRYGEELERFPLVPGGETSDDGRARHGGTFDGFYYENGYFGAGDAECYYSMIRHFRPRRIVEIGAGHSTRIARAAARANLAERVVAGTDGRAGAGVDTGVRVAAGTGGREGAGVDTGQRAGAGEGAFGAGGDAYDVDHVCIEPYENPWLERLDVRLIREPVETVPLEHFTTLEANDILFIDSSHVVRPGGDVLHEFLEILPALRPGVLVHVHDIFTPRDYPDHWLVDKMLLWNEQYLLEAFLTHNDRFEVIGALSFLAHDHTEAFCEAFPVFGRMRPRPEPGSFWMRKG